MQFSIQRQLLSHFFVTAGEEAAAEMFVKLLLIFTQIASVPYQISFSDQTRPQWYWGYCVYVSCFSPLHLHRAQCLLSFSPSLVAWKWEQRVLNLTADEPSVQGTARGREGGCRSGFSGVDRWLPAYRRRHSVIRSTSDTAAQKRGEVGGHRVQADTSQWVSVCVHPVQTWATTHVQSLYSPAVLLSNPFRGVRHLCPAFIRTCDHHVAWGLWKKPPQCPFNTFLTTLIWKQVTP